MADEHSVPMPGNGTPRWIGLGSAALGAAALFNRWSAARAERAHPPIGQFLEIEGTRLHYAERGSGSAIVLIHGSASLIEDFVTSGLVDRLARRHRVIVFDRPGYGYSSRPRGIDWTPERQAALLVNACAALAIDRPVVVGHSWGTLVALAWALDHTDRIGQLALLSGYFYPTSRPDAPMAAMTGAPIIGDLLTHTVVPLQTRLTGPAGNRMLFAPAEPGPAYLEQMPFGLMLRPGQLRATAIDSGQMPASAARLEPRYASLALPIAILWGDGDKLVQQSGQSARLAKELSDVVAVELRGAGHMIHHIDPDRVAAEIERVADRGSGSR